MDLQPKSIEQMKRLVLLFGIASNASASLLIKLALQSPFTLPSLTEAWRVIENWPLLLGLFFYGSAFVLYAVALNFFPLNIAHPILTSGAIASVAVLSVVVLGESLRPAMIAGLGLIMFGVILPTSGAR
jgi:small multidrug resistance pump